MKRNRLLSEETRTRLYVYGKWNYEERIKTFGINVKSNDFLRHEPP